MKIRSEKHMKESGWVKDANGTWVAPHEKGLQVARYDANGKKLVSLDEEGCGRVTGSCVNLVEGDRTELGSHAEHSNRTLPTEKEIIDQQVHAYQKAGLSHAEAMLAANPQQLAGLNKQNRSGGGFGW